MNRGIAALAATLLAVGCEKPKPLSQEFVGPLFASIPDGPKANIEIRADDNGTVRMLWRFEQADSSPPASGVAVMKGCQVFSAEHWDCTEGQERIMLDGNTLKVWNSGFEVPLILQRVNR